MHMLWLNIIQMFVHPHFFGLNQHVIFLSGLSLKLLMHRDPKKKILLYIIFHVESVTHSRAKDELIYVPFCSLSLTDAHMLKIFLDRNITPTTSTTWPVKLISTAYTFTCFYMYFCSFSTLCSSSAVILLWQRVKSASYHGNLCFIRVESSNRAAYMSLESIAVLQSCE